MARLRIWVAFFEHFGSFCVFFMKNARFFNRNPLFRKNTKLQFVPLLPLKEKHRFQKVGKLQNCLSTAHDDHGFSKKKSVTLAILLYKTFCNSVKTAGLVTMSSRSEQESHALLFTFNDFQGCFTHQTVQIRSFGQFGG